MLNETWNYVRMSTDLQEDSPLTQDQHTDSFINGQNLPVWTRTYFDLAVSAGSMDRRPGLLQLIADAERERPAAVVFYKLDRAFRNSYEQGVAMQRLKRAGVRILKVADPNIEGPQGELIDTVLGAVAQFERELTGMRIRDHNQAMARRGEWPGGAPPFGYRYIKAVRETHGRKRVTIAPGRLEPDPVEWPIARQIWDWALAGYRKSEIAGMANAAGYRRRNGEPWDTEAIRLILINKTYAGYVPFGRNRSVHGRRIRQDDRAEWYPGQHQPMVTLEEYLQVQATTNTKVGQRRPHRRPRNELAGLIRCSICGGPVAANGTYPDGGYQYGCMDALLRGVQHPTWNRRDWVIHMALEQILDQIVESYLPTAPAAISIDDQRAAAEREVEAVRRQIKRLRDLYLMGEFEDDMEEYQRRRAELDARLRAAEVRLAKAGPSMEQVQANWERLRDWREVYLATEGNVRERQRFWATFFESILTDGRTLLATLRNFGPGVPREWEVELPPVRTRRPGTQVGRGIVGERKRGRTRSAILNGVGSVRPVR